MQICMSHNIVFSIHCFGWAKIEKRREEKRREDNIVRATSARMAHSTDHHQVLPHRIRRLCLISLLPCNLCPSFKHRFSLNINSIFGCNHNQTKRDIKHFMNNLTTPHKNAVMLMCIVSNIKCRTLRALLTSREGWITGQHQRSKTKKIKKNI